MFKLFNFSITAILLGLIFIGVSNAQWQEAVGPDGGVTTCLAEHDSMIFAGTLGGVYKSTDSGLTWTNVSSGLPTTYIYDLYATPFSIYTCSYEGIFRSDDDGG